METRHVSYRLAPKQFKHLIHTRVDDLQKPWLVFSFFLGDLGFDLSDLQRASISPAPDSAVTFTA